MMIQLDPAIPMETPKGPAIAHFLIDYGIEHDLQWVCFIDETGECWTYKNTEIRAQKNITWGRLCGKKLKHSEDGSSIYSLENLDNPGGSE